MKRNFTLIFCLIITFGFSQIKEIQIEFIGNCGLHMTDGITNFYIDFPYKSGAHGYMEFEESELDSVKENSIFIFTHKHSDHYSKRNLKKVIKKKGGETYGVSNISELEELGESIENFEIETFKTDHTVFGISFRHYSYLITWHNKKIYLSGDTTEPKTIGKMEKIDLAFVPYWILENAKEQNMTIDAKLFAVYHLHPDQIPSAKENWDEVENIRPLVEQGDKITIELESERTTVDNKRI
ncbi:MBL fold metallo-hydrolase [Winogradskyella forsetii]|uniref:MBL fold metallo-hydrolase n=1 Tax=Winogradskyella forsetii TaxID=2686077 RepID=UPI0015BEE0E9|nr:MBL fold metallo-hydrolase [Winogradskyella forsetii]